MSFFEGKWDLILTSDKSVLMSKKLTKLKCAFGNCIFAGQKKHYNYE